MDTFERFFKKYTLNFSPGSHLFDHPINQFQTKKNIISNVFKKVMSKNLNFKD